MNLKHLTIKQLKGLLKEISLVSFSVKDIVIKHAILDELERRKYDA
jgi:hypothetical protein